MCDTHREQVGPCSLEVNVCSGNTEEMWIGNKPPSSTSPALYILLRLNSACNSQKEEDEEDRGEKKEYNIIDENRCPTREALMTVLLCLTPPLPTLKSIVQLLCFIHSAAPSPVPPYDIA